MDGAARWSKDAVLLKRLGELRAGFCRALPLPRAAAQSTGQGKIEGQLVEGTHDAQLSGTNGLSVTLHMAPANATSTVTHSNGNP